MSIVFMVATVVSPFFTVAAAAALLAFLLSIVAFATGSFRAGSRWLLVLAVSSGIAFATAPVVPDRNQGMALGDCRAVSSAQEAYRSSNGGSFGQLSCLAAPESCGFPAGTTSFLDTQLAGSTPKQGYSRRFVAGPRGSGKPDPGISSFVYVATPLEPGRGKRAFAVDSSGLFCFTEDGSSPPILDGKLAPTCNVLK